MSLFAELRRRNVFKMTVVYVLAGWALLQVADIVIPALGIPEWGVTFVLVLIALGFPIAVIFSWVYEITPDGIRKEKDITPEESIADRTGARLNYLIVSLLIIIAAMLAVNLLGPWSSKRAPGVATAIDGNRSATAEPMTPVDDGLISVAVLPFINMSNDPDNEYFSDGISEELLNVLVKVDGLRVPSRTSSFAFKGEEKSIAEIAQALKVDHVLEGSVRKAGNTVRVTAQLIDVSTDTHLWSDTYDRELTDIFAIQDEIANSIVEALAGTLGAQVAAVSVEAPTASLEAYQLYLRGRHLWWTRYGDAVPRAIDLLKHAVELDPDFARAWSGLAAAYEVASTYTDMPDGEAKRLALEAAERALALDPAHAEAQAVLAQHLANDRQFLEAAATYDQAVRTDPTDVLSRAWYALFLSNVGYTTEALKYFRSVEDLDPINALAQAHLGILNEFLGSREEALRYSSMAERAGMHFAIMLHYEIAMQEGRYGDAYDVVADFLATYGDTNPCLEPLREVLGGQAETAVATTCIDSTPLFMNGADWHVPDYDLQIADRAVRAFEERTGLFSTPLQWVWGPRGQFVRQSPEFREFAERIGLADLWRERGWPDLCRPAGNSFECD